jgi:hypothetical protein
MTVSPSQCPTCMRASMFEGRSTIVRRLEICPRRSCPDTPPCVGAFGCASHCVIVHHWPCPISVEVNRFMTGWQLFGHLLMNQLHPKVERHFGPHPRWYASGIAAALDALSRFHVSLLSSVAKVATPAIDFTACRAAIPTHNFGNLLERLIRFHEAVDLASFICLKCLYIGQLRLGG